MAKFLHKNCILVEIISAVQKYIKCFFKENWLLCQEMIVLEFLEMELQPNLSLDIQVKNFGNGGFNDFAVMQCLDRALKALCLKPKVI